MAKVKVIFGKLRGKMGGVVFRGGDNGETIASEYNGEPRNPRTMLQTAQRSKMNVAGKISKATPYSAIAGLGGNRRQARSKYVSNLLKLAENQQQGRTQIDTSVNLSSLEISKGRSVSISGTVSIVSQSNSVQVSITGVDPTVTLLGVKVVAYLPIPGGFGGVVVKDVAYSDIDNPIMIPLPGNYSDYGGDDTVNVLVVPMIDTGESARVSYTQYLSEESVSITGGAVRTLLSTGSYGQSSFLGSVVIE